jgi:BirA family transcriptional regulator, biotin operon repressor / biotin---[acetyl-CoA-carboxylase] ligase
VSPPLVRLRETPSTQDELHRLAEEGAPAGTAVVAETQEAGRGSRGRGWVSAPGGLWLSVLWRGPADVAQLLSIRAGLAVARVLDGIGGLPPVRLKWPNDVIIDDAKVGGILCEGRWGAANSWVAVGLGLNVTNPLPSDARFPPASLSQWRPDLDAPALAAPVAAALSGLPATPRLSDEELGAWRERDWLAGKRLRAPVAGVIGGMSAAGRLLVDTDAGRLELVASDGIEV